MSFLYRDVKLVAAEPKHAGVCSHELQTVSVS